MTSASPWGGPTDSGARWFVVVNGAAAGPFAAADIRRMVDDGQITPGALVAREGSQEWNPLMQDDRLVTAMDASPAQMVQAAIVNRLADAAHKSRNRARRRQAPAPRGRPSSATGGKAGSSIGGFILLGLFILFAFGKDVISAVIRAIERAQRRNDAYGESGSPGGLLDGVNWGWVVIAAVVLFGVIALANRSRAQKGSPTLGGRAAPTLLDKLMGGRPGDPVLYRRSPPPYMGPRGGTRF